MSKPPLINASSLGMLVRQKRYRESIGGGAFERATGISKSGLSRIENGRGDVLTAENFLRLMVWLNIDPRLYVSELATSSILDRLTTLIAHDLELTIQGREVVMAAATKPSSG